MGSWLPIRYREFYDIPRAVVVDWQGVLYLLDCPFDFEVSEYPSHYDVYTLPRDLLDEIEVMSWTDLAHYGRHIGTVATVDVQFDETRRKAMDSEALRLLGGESADFPDGGGEP